MKIMLLMYIKCTFHVQEKHSCDISYHYQKTGPLDAWQPNFRRIVPKNTRWIGGSIL